MPKYNPNAKSMKAYAGKSAGKSVSTQAGLTDSDSQTLLEVRENNAKIIEESIHSAIMAGLEEIGLVAEGYAKRLCPVDTGRLRNSITHAIFDGNAPYVIIGTNVEYSLYVHEGVHGRKGQPFLTDAVTHNANEYRRILEAALKSS